jgi:hypothetical protein
MQIINFPTLVIGATFAVDGEVFTKLTELTFRDAYGMEHYIDPLFDAKLGRIWAEAKAEADKTAAAAAAVDTSAKIVKDEPEQ